MNLKGDIKMSKFELASLVNTATQHDWAFYVDSEGNMKAREAHKIDEELTFTNELEFEKWLHEGFNLENGTEVIMAEVE